MRMNIYERTYKHEDTEYDRLPHQHCDRPKDEIKNTIGLHPDNCVDKMIEVQVAFRNTASLLYLDIGSVFYLLI